MRVIIRASLLHPVHGLGRQPSEAGIVRHVNRTDAACGGQSPCYGSIQAAVNAAQPGDTVQIQAGTYVEQVSVIAKNARRHESGESDRDPGRSVRGGR